jgi:hypothetical protein
MGMYEDFAACTLIHHHALRLAPRKNKRYYIKHRSALFCQGIIKNRRQETEFGSKKKKD